MLNRRALLSLLTSTAAAGLATACRERPDDGAEIIRTWFRAQQWDPPSDGDIEAIRRHFTRRAVRPDPTLQPGLLFNAEVVLD